jgi:hypothetical protein
MSDESNEIVSRTAVLLPLLGSMVLLLLFFFFDMIYYAFVALVAFSSVAGVAFTISPLFESLFKLVRRRLPFIPTEIPYLDPTINQQQQSNTADRYD